MNKRAITFETALKVRSFEAFGARNSARDAVLKVSFYFISILFILLISINCPAQLVNAIKKAMLKR